MTFYASPACSSPDLRTLLLSEGFKLQKSNLDIWVLSGVGSFVINPGNFALFCREHAEHRVGPKWNSGQPTPGASLCFGQRPASPDSPDRRGRPSASSKYSFLTVPSVLYSCFPRAQFRLSFSFLPEIWFPEVHVIKARPYVFWKNPFSGVVLDVVCGVCV